MILNDHHSQAVIRINGKETFQCDDKMFVFYFTFTVVCFGFDLCSN